MPRATPGWFRVVGFRDPGVGTPAEIAGVRALRLLGLGDSTTIDVPSDGQSRIDPVALDKTLKNLAGPTIVCVESGNVNTGSFDPFHAVADATERHRERGNPTWVHVDGAVALWARASADRSSLADGLERLDSWRRMPTNFSTCPTTPASQSLVTRLLIRPP